MKISKEEYRERAARVAAGTESDDDRRLVALYADEMAGDDGGQERETSDDVSRETKPKLSTRRR